ncbi:helix-turn-helix transcriptional regulator [Lentzea sp.]|uniref:helix-turn-helix domain-containing protein n=1 Tax=Lentzea sp. TaxID=56099 RepID=UPI002B9D7674|nr:helix-turn-helix transcriptional regulator [Lentzea sp.]HUQ58506.1 helix-turn-helix transcriptional regulator [Lentzea sp.]
MSEPTFRQKRLGDALKFLRERAGLTQKEAAMRLSYNVPKLSRIENGQLPDIHALRAMLDLYGVIIAEEEPYLQLYELAAERGWWTEFGPNNVGYINLEHDASEIWDFQATFIPGLFQDESYIREVFDKGPIKRSVKWVNDETAKRLRRKARLFGDRPLTYRVIISEHALRHASRSQLVHVHEMCALPNVTAQVLPDSAPLHDGSFTIIEFPDPKYPKILYVEHVGGAITDEDLEKVQAAKLAFKRLSKLALTPDESAAWIERLAAER